MKINLFTTQSDDFKTMLDSVGVTVLINNKPTKTLITNPTLNELDDKYISTTTELKRGDHIQFNNQDWYVISQVTSKRHESYKAIIRCAEHYIRFNLSSYTSFDVKEVPCIMETIKQFGLNDSGEMIMADGQLALTVQDNPTTRAIYASFGNGQDIAINGRQYEYTGFDFTKKGLITINVQVTTKGTIFDGIVWKHSRSGWNKFIDNSFYNDVKPEPVVPDEPGRTTTNVGTITATTTNASGSYDSDGTMDISFKVDPMATSYRVILLDDSNSVSDQISSINLAVTFSDLYHGTYSVTIESFNGTEYLAPQRLDDIFVESDAEGSGWGEW